MVDRDRIASYTDALEFAQRQVTLWTQTRPDAFPIYASGGSRQSGEAACPGGCDCFLIGLMWQFYRRTGNSEWSEQAQAYRERSQQRPTVAEQTHPGLRFSHADLPCYEATGDRKILTKIIEAGQELAGRFRHRERYLGDARGALSIDTMADAALLEFVANETLDQDLARVAVAHCRTTRDRLVRPNGSVATEGVICEQSGELLPATHNSESQPDATSAQGLACSLYGFSKMYELTEGVEFLKVAERNAEFWIMNLPDDRVPYRRFAPPEAAAMPQPNPKYAAAAAMAASALWDLAVQTRQAEHTVAYRTESLAMLDALIAPEYLTTTTEGWERILKHGAQDIAEGSGEGESTIWGDYYLVEALTKVLMSR